MMLTAVLIFVVAWTCPSFAANDCPHGWILYQSSCYGFGDEDVTWEGAQEFCQLFHSNLAEVETSGENEFLKSVARNRNYATMWLGGTDVFTEGIWIWAGSQEPVEFSDWHAGEPSSSHGAENCLMLYKPLNYQWNDGSCHMATKFVCETRVEDKIIG